MEQQLSDSNLLCPPSPNTSCPSSPGSQRQVNINQVLYNLFF